MESAGSSPATTEALPEESPKSEPAAYGAAAADGGTASSSAAPSNPSAARNLKKKLRQRYLDILRLEEQLGAGLALNAEQQAKVARKAEVAAQLQELDCELPELPPAPAGAAASTPGALGSISEADVLAAMEALAVGERPPPPAGLLPNPRPPSQALRYQQSLRKQNPGFSYFFALPSPLPDIGVQLTDPVGAAFFEIVVRQAEAGQPRAVKMVYQQLKQSAEQQGLPLMQLRIQLLTEYGVDPITEQPFEGTDQQALSWVEAAMPPAEMRQARKDFERLVQSLMMQQQMGGGGGGGGRGGRRGSRRR